MRAIWTFCGYVVGAIVSAAMIYGVYWIGKTLSYAIFYESMVRQTVLEMVKAGALK